MSAKPRYRVKAGRGLTVVPFRLVPEPDLMDMLGVICDGAAATGAVSGAFVTIGRDGCVNTGYVRGQSGSIFGLIGGLEYLQKRVLEGELE
jgi:hypothetical protein